MEYLFIIISVLFLTIGQLFQKQAMNNVTKSIDTGNIFYLVFRQKEIWWAVISLSIATAIWLIVLYKMEVSKAYPYLSINFILISLVSRFYFKENITLQRWIGVGFIAIGTGLVTLS